MPDGLEELEDGAPGVGPCANVAAAAQPFGRRMSFSEHGQILDGLEVSEGDSSEVDQHLAAVFAEAAGGSPTAAPDVSTQWPGSCCPCCSASGPEKASGKFLGTEGTERHT